MDEALWGTENSKKLANLRKAIANHRPAEAINTVMNVLKKYPNNTELLKILPA